MASLPEQLRSHFWNVDFDALDDDRDADHVLLRVLEYGTIDAVRWAISRYGLDRIHLFLRTSGSTELSDRTIAFWRCVLDAKEEEWARPPQWRRPFSSAWIA